MNIKLLTKNILLAAVASLAILTLAVRTADATDVKIYTGEEPPTNYSDSGKLTGTTVDIVEALRASLGVANPIELMPFNRITQSLAESPNVLAFTLGRTPEREQLGYHFIGPVMTRGHALWARKGSGLKISSLEDVKNQGLVVGDLMGVWRVKFLEDAGVKVEATSSAEANLKKLMAGRITFVACSKIDMASVAKLAGVSIDEFEPVFVFKDLSSYLVFSKDTDKDTLDQWQAAFTKLQATPFFSETAEKWSKTLGYRLSYSNDKGFYAP